MLEVAPGMVHSSLEPVAPFRDRVAHLSLTGKICIEQCGSKTLKKVFLPRAGQCALNAMGFCEEMCWGLPVHPSSLVVHSAWEFLGWVVLGETTREKTCTNMVACTGMCICVKAHKNIRTHTHTHKRAHTTHVRARVCDQYQWPCVEFVHMGVDMST